MTRFIFILCLMVLPHLILSVPQCYCQSEGRVSSQTSVDQSLKLLGSHYKQIVGDNGEDLQKHLAFIEREFSHSSAGSLIRFYKAKVAETPDSIILRRALAAVYKLAGKITEAMAQLEQCRKLAPEDVTVLLLLALHSDEIGEHQRSISLCLQALKLEPDNVMCYRILAIVYEGLKNYQEAASLYERALRIDPSNVSCRIGLADAYLNMQQLDLALEYAKEIAESGVQESEVHDIIGDAHRLKNEYSLALDEYYKALLLDPKDERALFGIEEIRSAATDAIWRSALMLFSPVILVTLIAYAVGKLHPIEVDPWWNSCGCELTDVLVVSLISIMMLFFGSLGFGKLLFGNWLSYFRVPEYREKIDLISSIMAHLSLAGLCLLWLRSVRGHNIKDVGLRWGRTRPNLNWIIRGLFVYLALDAACLLFFYRTHYEPIWQDGMPGVYVVIFWLIVVAILVPFCEEIFRGFTYSAIRRKVRMPIALLLTSVLCGSWEFHSGSGWILVSVSLSHLLYTFLYERTGSILPSLAFHSLSNALALLLYYLLL